MKPDKNIEEFTKYVLKEANLETPSVNFVADVMNAVEAEKSHVISTIVYKPLISKLGWILISILIVSISIFVVTGTFETPDIVSKMSTSVLDTFNSINYFERITFSSTFTFCFVLFSAFVVLQLVTINKYVNKQHMG